MKNKPHSNLSTVPPLDAATVEYAERLFPEKCPNPNDHEREVWMKAGERRAVNRLRNLLDKQEKQNVSL